MRITTLLQTANRINQGEAFHFCLKEFLDGFLLSNNKQSLIDEQPDSVECGNPFIEDDAYNALLAGLADEITAKYKLERPRWTAKSVYFLIDPVFTCNDNPEKRAILLAETPSYYRVRNLFCGKIFTPIQVNT